MFKQYFTKYKNLLKIKIKWKMIKKNLCCFFEKIKLITHLASLKIEKKLPKSRIKREHHYNPFKNQKDFKQILWRSISQQIRWLR